MGRWEELTFPSQSHPGDLFDSYVPLSGRSPLASLFRGCMLDKVGSWLLSDSQTHWVYVEFGPLAAVSSQSCQGSLPPGRHSYLCVLLLSGPQATSKRRDLVFILSRVYLGAGSLVTTDSVLESTWRLLAIWFKAGALCHRAKGIEKDGFSQLTNLCRKGSLLSNSQ